MSPVTLSLADVAALAQVQRPVVSMWRRRDKDGIAFPAPLPGGRFDGLEVVEWLERTGRGNNSEARAELAVHAVTSAHEKPARLLQVLCLLTARTLVDEPLVSFDYEELLDAVDELDPDDQFLFSELERLDAATLEATNAEVDAVADAAWHPRAAYERILDAIVRASPGHDERLHPDLVSLLAALTRGALDDEGSVVDVLGSSADIVVALAADEDLPTPAVTLPQPTPSRDVLRRYRTHGLRPRLCAFSEPWPSSAGDVILVRLPDEPNAAFDLLDEVALQLTDAEYAFMVGPAALLTDPLPATLMSRRDELLRSDLVRAAVRLPAGLTRGGTREHLALWLMARPMHPVQAPLRVGDLSGRPLDRVVRQSLLDDLLAVVNASVGRAYDVLDPVDRLRTISRGGSLVAHDQARRVAYAPDPADDAARLQQLRSALAQPLPDAFPYAAVSTQLSVPRTVMLGDAQRHRMVRVMPGARIPELAPGTTRLWTAKAVAAHQAQHVDLLKLTAAVPGLKLTEPGDVVFTNHAKPAAIIDAVGGSAVAYPARILRVTSHHLAPSAVADAVRRVPAGNAKWRTWVIPMLQVARTDADDLLNHLDTLDAQLRERLALAGELRRLVTRSVLSGAITVTPSSSLHEKGH